MKILFYTNIPSPYRVDFFNELGKYCDLTVIFETGSSRERADAWKEYKFQNFNGIILEGIRTRIDASFCPQIIKYLNKNTFDYIVVTQLASLTALCAVAYMRIKHIRYCYEGDGGFVGNTKGIKAALKRFIIGNAEFCFSTSRSFDEYCSAYGAKDNAIYRYPFSSIKEKDILNRVLTKEEKKMYKRIINAKEEHVLLAVGQFIHRKGFDLLLDMGRLLPENVGIYIVGGIPTEEYLEKKERWNLKHVHFLDFMRKNELVKYYQAADLFVFPTREDIWGLVVNEAMAYGLPVISTERCAAAIEMIQNGINGYIIPINDVTKMTQSVENILNDNKLLHSMADNALKIARNYTIEEMAQVHLKIFEKELR